MIYYGPQFLFEWKMKALLAARFANQVSLVDLDVAARNHSALIAALRRVFADEPRVAFAPTR